MPQTDEKKIGMTARREQDFVEWYNQAVLGAELADYAPVRGFMVIRPNAYAIWEAIQAYFNRVMEKRKVRNAYFPLTISTAAVPGSRNLLSKKC